MEKRFKKGDKVVFASLSDLCASTEGDQDPVHVEVQEREVRGAGAVMVSIYGSAYTTEPLSFSTSFFATSNFDPGKVSSTGEEALRMLDTSLQESERRLLVMLERVRQGRAQVAEKLVGAGARLESAPRLSDAVVDKLRRHAEKPLSEGGESPGFSILACRNILKALGIPFDPRDQ